MYRESMKDPQAVKGLIETYQHFAKDNLKLMVGHHDAARSEEL